MPIYTIAEHDDSRLEQRQLQTTFEFRLDLEDFPELSHTAVVQPSPLVWPTTRADVDMSEKTDASRSEDDTGTQHD